MPNDNSQNTQNTPPPLAGVAQGIPPAQTLNQNPTVTKTSTGSGIDLPPVIVNPATKIGGGFRGGKMVATILGILVLVGGLGAGVFLTKQSQDIREKAAIDIMCSINSTGGCSDQTYGYACAANSTCTYPPDISVGSDDNLQICECISTVVATTPPVDTFSIQCSSVKAYSVSGSTWTTLSSSDLTNLEEGDIIYFAVNITYPGTSGDAASPIDQVKFTINSIEQSAATAKTPTCDGAICEVEFYQAYTIPADTDSFTVTAKSHLESTDTWY